ncbi:MAG: hypothetical protein NTV49_14115 [Kiritimatiellaeota bacterium]|nr:hypothetical protein [Kiritimatiellota bacterium]
MMKMIMVGLLLTVAGAGTLRAETAAEQLLAGYERVRSVSCEIRRDMETSTQKLRWLSRVYFQRPDRLHVDNSAPLPRRIVADGTNFFSYAEGDRKGFSRPIAELDTDMLLSLRKVPGTAMEHLLRLRGIAETNLPATAEFPVRRGYAAPKTFVVLSLDASNRLARVEFFAQADQRQKTAQYDYSAFQEVAPGAWIPCLHKGVFNLGGVESRETTRVNNLAVNQAIPPKFFDHGPFFQKVEFVGSFDEIYK